MGIPGVAAVAARQRRAGEQLGDALVKHRAIIAAGLHAQRTGKPALTPLGRLGQVAVA